MVRRSAAYRNRQKFKFRPIPGRTHRIERIPIHFNDETRTLGEWSFRLGRKPKHVWRELKRGVPIAEVLGGALDSGRGDWPGLRAKLKRIGL
jgi:hypothetical protein